MKKTKAGRHRRQGSRRNRPAPTSGLILTQDYRDHDFVYWPRPTEMELARLAAQLARGETIAPQQLIQDAWNLYWESCRRLKQDHGDVKRYFEAEDQFDAALLEDLDGGAEPIPQPKTFPVSFLEMERLLLPKLKGRTADRAVVVREYVFAGIIRNQRAALKAMDDMEGPLYSPQQLDELREQARDQITSEFTRLRIRTFDEPAYLRFAHDFLDWYRAYRANIQSEIKSANAKSGWQKRKQQKRGKKNARPNHAALREILELAETTPLTQAAR